MLEEASTSSLPLDKESDDAVLLGLDLDTTFSTADDHEHPLPPVPLAYVSDGMVQAWYVSVKDAGASGGMHLVDPNATSSGVAAASTSSIAAQSVMDPDELAKPATTAFGSGGFRFSPQTTSSFGQPTLPSVFGQSSQPAQTTPAFGQTTQMSQATFGQPSFGSSTTTSAFGKTCAFGKLAFEQTANPAFGQSSCRLRLCLVMVIILGAADSVHSVCKVTRSSVRQDLALVRLTLQRRHPRR